MEYMKYNSLAVLSFSAFLTLAGCIDITEVQKDYVADRDYCNQKSKDVLRTYFSHCSNTTNEKDKTNVTNETFCECMKDHGWRTARALNPPYPECPKPPGSIDTKSK